MKNKIFCLLIITTNFLNAQYGQWKSIAPMNFERTFHATVFLKTGEVLVTGGGGTVHELASCEIYNPITDS